MTSSSTGSAFVYPSETTSRPLSSSERKRISSISAAGVLDLGARVVEQLRHVGARKLGRVDQREDPGERCSQLVGDGGGEAHPQLVEAHVVGDASGGDRDEHVVPFVTAGVVLVPRSPGHRIVTISSPIARRA